MYSVDGDFGKVRTVSFLPARRAGSVFDYIQSAGWHRCNDRYHIRRDTGCDTSLIFFTTGGCGRMSVGGRDYPLPAGTTAILPAGAAHEYYVPEGGEWEFYWMHVGGVSAGSLLNYLLAGHGPVIDTGDQTRELCSAVESLLFLKTATGGCPEARVSLIVTQLLHQIIIALEEKDGGGLGENDAVKKLMQHLQTHYGSRISIEDISRSLYLNPAYLTRRFKARTGYTPYEYLTRYRIMMAKEMLAYTDLSVKEIAARTGFAHPSNFIHQFRSLESVTPGAFRRHTAGRSGGSG